MTTMERVDTEAAWTPQHAPKTDCDAAGCTTTYYPADSHALALGEPGEPFGAIVGFQISYSVTSVAVSAKFALGSIFGASGTADEKAIFFDAVATTNYYAEATAANGRVLYALRRGIGARLALRVRNLAVESNLSFAGIAAQAKFSTTEVNYEFQAIGIPPDHLKKMLGVIPTCSTLDEKCYRQIDRVLRVDLPAYLESEQPLATGEYIVVPQDDNAAPWSGTAHGVNFAMMQIARGLSLAEALKVLDKSNQPIEHFIVQYTYGKETGTTDPASTQAPSSDLRTTAKHWLNV